MKSKNSKHQVCLYVIFTLYYHWKPVLYICFIDVHMLKKSAI